LVTLFSELLKSVAASLCSFDFFLTRSRSDYGNYFVSAMAVDEVPVAGDSVVLFNYKLEETLCEVGLVCTLSDPDISHMQQPQN